MRKQKFGKGSSEFIKEKSNKMQKCAKFY